MQLTENYGSQINEYGFALIPECLTDSEVERAIVALKAGVADHRQDAAVRSRREVYAVRNLLDIAPGLRGIQRWPVVRHLVEPVLGAGAALVRAILFDKTADANWGVFWHQDLSIAVRERVDLLGFDRWSIKAGVVHVEPSVEILERMLTVRLHLDACSQNNGALKVVLGSHRHGRLSSAAMDNLVAAGRCAVCELPAGGAMVMRPLLLHSSPKASVSGHRRVLHLEFSADKLPAPLEWFQKETIVTESAYS